MKYSMLTLILLLGSWRGYAKAQEYRCIDSSGHSVLEFRFKNIEEELVDGSLTPEEFIKKVKFSKWVPAYLHVTKDDVGRALKLRTAYSLFPEHSESTSTGYTGSIILDTVINADSDYYMSKELHLHRVFTRHLALPNIGVKKKEFIRIETSDSMHATYKIYDDGELSQVRLLCSHQES